MVSVVMLSHNHPMGPTTQPAVDYGMPAEIRPESGAQSLINLTPRSISIHDLCTVKNLKEPRALTGDVLNNLLIKTGMFCPWT